MPKEPDITKFTEIRRLQWGTHVIRMDDSMPAKRAVLSNSGDIRVRRRRTFA